MIIFFLSSIALLALVVAMICFLKRLSDYEWDISSLRISNNHNLEYIVALRNDINRLRKDINLLCEWMDLSIDDVKVDTRVVSSNKKGNVPKK